jgi:hypothetical protein
MKNNSAASAVVAYLVIIRSEMMYTAEMGFDGV